MCHHVFAKNSVPSTWNKGSFLKLFHRSSWLLHIPGDSSQVSDQPHPYRVGWLWFYSPFVLVSFWIFLGLAIPACLRPSLSFIFLFSSPVPQHPWAPLICFLGLCHAYVLIPLPGICCLPSRGPVSKPSPASCPRLHGLNGGVELAWNLVSEPYGSDSGSTNHWWWNTGH